MIPVTCGHRCWCRISNRWTTSDAINYFLVTPLGKDDTLRRYPAWWRHMCPLLTRDMWISISNFMISFSDILISLHKYHYVTRSICLVCGALVTACTNTLIQHLLQTGWMSVMLEPIIFIMLLWCKLFTLEARVKLFLPILKLCLATVTHNFKWIKNTYIQKKTIWV